MKGLHRRQPSGNRNSATDRDLQAMSHREVLRGEAQSETGFFALALLILAHPFCPSADSSSS